MSKILEEEIFESSSSSNCGNIENNNLKNGYSSSIILDNNISIASSLEFFNNKIYYSNNDRSKDIISTTSNRNNVYNNSIMNENPTIKYEKLKKELAVLDKDLKELLSSTIKPDDANVWTMIQAETAKLRNQADGMAGHKGFQIYNNLIQSSVEKIQEASKNISSSSSSSSTTTTTTTTPTTTTTSTSSIGSSQSSSSLTSLDHRLFTIETLLGYSSNVLESSSSLSSSAPGLDMTITGRGIAIPIMDTINKIENKIKLLSTSSQESLIKKAEMLKAELDSVNSMISSPSSSSSPNLYNAAKAVDDLYEKVQFIEGISSDIPKIYNRLQYLEQLSLISSSFDQRIDKMKIEIGDIQTLLKTNDESIVSMKSSLSEQMNTLVEACKKIGK